MRALLVVILAAAAALAYVAWPGRGAKDDSAAYRHYYAMGRRLCHESMLDLKPPPGITGWSSFTQVALEPSAKLPARYQRAMIAGCNAAR
jgi:hypothetical protein